MARRQSLQLILFSALAACGSSDRSTLDAAPAGYMPTQVTVLASNELRPNGIVADENAAYFVSAGQTSSLRKIDLKSLAVTTLVPDIGQAPRIAADADHVYFATGELTGVSRVVMVDKATGAPTNLASNEQSAHMVVVDDDAVYWETDDGTHTIVRSIKKDGSGLRTVGSFGSETLYDMVVDAHRLYALGTSAVISMDKATGATTTLTSSINGIERNLAQDATSLYVSDRTDDTIKLLPKTGGTAITLASNQSSPGRLAVTDDGTVYWAVRGANADGSTTLGAMRKLPSGTSTAVDIATSLDHGIEPTLLSHAVLWTVYGPLGTSAATTAGGSVMAAPL
jgi:hypothetical protein